MSANTKDIPVYLKSNLLFEILWFSLFWGAVISGCLCLRP